MPPEEESDTRCDPFMTDVFLVGNMMLKHFIDVSPKDLVGEMLERLDVGNRETLRI